MPSNFFTSHKFATIAELRYLLLEVLDRPDPISWYDLSFSCKEFSLNFAFAFENTIDFLNQLSIIEIQKDKSVKRVDHTDYKTSLSDNELAVFILRKTIQYLEKNLLLLQIFKEDGITVVSEDIIIDTSKIPAGFIFIRSLFLNLGVATQDKDKKEMLIVSSPCKTYFRKEFLKVISRHRGTDTEKEENNFAGSPDKKPTFFISYAHRDEQFKEELQNHFSGLVNQGVIESWDSRAILAGQDWDKEVKENLEKAEIILFLVSSDFMASQYINDIEIKKAIERHNKNLTKIIPIIIRPCDYKSLPIGRYQALPKNALPITEWKSRDSAYLDIVTQMRRILLAEHK